jgi:hypothetical protein
MKKDKEVLFITVDGKPVYENGKVFVIVSNAITNALTRRIVKKYASKDYGGLRYHNVQIRAFSTKDAASKHIDMLLARITSD